MHAAVLPFVVLAPACVHRASAHKQVEDSWNVRWHAGQARMTVIFATLEPLAMKSCSEGLLGHVDATPEACCRWTLVCTQTQLGWTSVNCARKKIDDSQT